MFKKTMIALFFLLSIALGWLFYGTGGVYAPVSHHQDEAIIIEKGMRMKDVADLLLGKKLISNRYAFYVAALLDRQWGRLKAGEFLIPDHARPTEIIRILCCGKVIVHKMTFPEGSTAHEIVDEINKISILKGEILHVPAEGFMLPDTYTYVYGDTKQSLVNRMEAAMIMVLAETWAKRKTDVPYENSLEALTLASIVEKETGRKDERKRIAGVFTNRLKKGMRLQADPTVIYGITLGKSKLGRKITKNDLKSETIYNTYLIEGLPPRPICCPGKAAIEAAMQPMTTKDLFFVANGVGGHNFSSSLGQHNAYVSQYRSGL